MKFFMIGIWVLFCMVGSSFCYVNIFDVIFIDHDYLKGCFYLLLLFYFNLQGFYIARQIDKELK